ncbi:hypothetical protein LINPERPRIM_LOCUS37059 [Linum perenne]
MICLLHRIRLISTSHRKSTSTYLKILSTTKFTTNNLKFKTMMIVITLVLKKGQCSDIGCVPKFEANY